MPGFQQDSLIHHPCMQPPALAFKRSNLALKGQLCEESVSRTMPYVFSTHIQQQQQQQQQHYKDMGTTLSSEPLPWRPHGPTLCLVCGGCPPAAGSLWCLLRPVLQVLQPILADADREPALRLTLLQLLDSLLEGPSTAPVFVSSGSNAELTMQSLLLPPLVWRAGKVGVNDMDSRSCRVSVVMSCD